LARIIGCNSNNGKLIRISNVRLKGATLEFHDEQMKTDYGIHERPGVMWMLMVLKTFCCGLRKSRAKAEPTLLAKRKPTVI
jgi:hypothetical protein